MTPKPWMFRCKGEDSTPKGGAKGETRQRAAPAQAGANWRRGNPAAKPAGEGLEPLANAWAW